MVALAKTPVIMSTDEFLTWHPNDGRMWQLVDGELHAMAPANRTHGAIQNELGSLIRNHLIARAPGCSVITTPGIIPRIRSNANVRVPDLVVTCSAYEAEEAALTDPVLVVEILSPGNQAATWANVWTYTTIPSVREILVLRSATIGAELVRRSPDGLWPETPQSMQGGVLTLESIGFQVPLADIYRTTRLARTG